MITYREMHIDDYTHVIELWLNTESMRLRDADSVESINRYLQHNPGLSFVAFDGDVLVGAVLVGTDGRRGYLQHLAVHTESRGQGVGKSLVDLSTAALERQGVPKTHLFVLNENVSAQAFYERLGWFVRDEVRMYSFNRSSNLNA
ncbi:GNAT family N-acetyltransferase [Vibrio olivae]|uniref:GNAT family N-acetyltransferase n=1 Tax=Vibrio olivae TaxID=1243002 RepID=A0ABV5HTR8_9VIBR